MAWSPEKLQQAHAEVVAHYGMNRPPFQDLSVDESMVVFCYEMWADGMDWDQVKPILMGVDKYFNPRTMAKLLTQMGYK